MASMTMTMAMAPMDTDDDGTDGKNSGGRVCRNGSSTTTPTTPSKSVCLGRGRGATAAHAPAASSDDGEGEGGANALRAREREGDGVSASSEIEGDGLEDEGGCKLDDGRMVIEETNGCGGDGSGGGKEKPGRAKGSSQPALRTVTITSEDVERTSTAASVVDPWVPRIRYNDEYLRSGLDFSPPPVAAADEDENDDAGDPAISPLVGEVGAVRLAGALSHNTYLVRLCLSRCGVGPGGGAALASCLYNPETLKSRTALRELDLSRNQVTDVGSRALAEALRHNKSLSELNLAGNGIRLDAALTLIDSLERNPRMKRLRLADNVAWLTASDAARVTMTLGGVLWSGCEGRNVLEALEMHPADDVRAGRETDGPGELSENEAGCLRRAMYGLDPQRTIASSDRARNVRFRVLTLPPRVLALPQDAAAGGKSSPGPDYGPGAGGPSEECRMLRRMLGFNSFYRPIRQLRDLRESPLARAEASLSLPTELPRHLRRDEGTGALVGLLPSASSSVNSEGGRRGAARGLDVKLLPRALSFACDECPLDVVWDVTRHRPDIFLFAREGGEVWMWCTPCCFGIGEAGCIVS